MTGTYERYLLMKNMAQHLREASERLWKQGPTGITPADIQDFEMDMKRLQQVLDEIGREQS